MDSRNVLFAVILSSIVLVVWAAFFEPPVVEKQKVNNEVVNNESISTPSVSEQESKVEINRSEIIKNTDRIKLENINIKGSISLQGAIIDDIVFKNYKKELEIFIKKNKL